MSKQSSDGTFQFETDFNGELIELPASVVEHLARSGAKKISVRILAKPISDTLTRLGVTEEEIDRIGVRQLEPRENVVRFLASQGALVSSRFAKRSAVL
jgi:hypothetical protein